MPNLLAALAALHLALGAATTPSAGSAALPDEPPAAPAIGPAAGTTASGTLGYLSLPALAAPEKGRIALGISGDWYRGGNFLLPDSTTQRTGVTGAVSVGLASYLEAYGALSFRSANLFTSTARRTLGSYGDADLGVKLIFPRTGPLAAGLLVQLDLPAGVGGFSLRGAGGFAAAILGLSGRLGVPLTGSLLAGYRIDNSSKLSKEPTTFSTFALNVSSYDRVEAGAGLQIPLRYLSPTAELIVESPVARQNALPVSGHPIRARFGFGLAQIQTGVPGLTGMAGVQLSLEQTGRLDVRALPMRGFAPDAPWTALAGLSWKFEAPSLPKPTRELSWHETKALEAPAKVAPPAALREKAHLVVTVLDSRSQLPLSGAWVSFVEGSDVGATTGEDGKARIDAESGPVTVALARDGYELVTEPLMLGTGEERQVVLSMQPIAADATVRGRIVGQDGAVLRAAVTVAPLGSAPSLPGASGADAQIFEGSYSIPVLHGSYVLAVYTPGFRADLASIEVRPGETATRDIVLRRIPNEATTRLGPTGVELSQPVLFGPGNAALFPSAFPVLAEVVEVLKGELRPLLVEARADALDVSAAANEELEGGALAAARAKAVFDYLIDKGVKATLLTPLGKGIAKPGQPLLELRVAPVNPPARAPGSRNETDSGRREAFVDTTRGHP